MLVAGASSQQHQELAYFIRHKPHPVLW